MTKMDFWHLLADYYIDCDDCVFFGDCNRVAQLNTEGTTDFLCAEELRRNYEGLKEGEDDE